MKTRFSPADKLQLVLDSYGAGNVRAFCQLHQVDPTTLYSWRRELAAAARAAWSSRRRGRPSRQPSDTLDSLRSQLEDLKQQHQALQEAERSARLWARLAQQILKRSGHRAGLRQLLGPAE